jgi:hypothetical protein
MKGTLFSSDYVTHSITDMTLPICIIFGVQIVLQMLL